MVRVHACSIPSVDGSAAETIAVFLAVFRVDGTDTVFATGTRVARALTANMPRVGGSLKALGMSTRRLSKRREAARNAGRGHHASESGNLIADRLFHVIRTVFRETHTRRRSAAIIVWL